MFCYIKVTAKGLILVLLPLIFGLSFVTVLTHKLTATSEKVERLRNSQKFLLHFNSLVVRFMRLSLIFADVQKEEPAERLLAAKEVQAYFQAPGHIGDVRLADMPELTEIYEETETNRKIFLKLTQRTDVKAFTNKDRDAIVMSLLTMRTLIDRLKTITNRLDNEEPGEVKLIFEQLIWVLAAGLLVSCALSFLVAYVFTFDIVRRLETISNNAYLIASGKPLPPPQKGTDEIAELDMTLHKTGLQLQAFQKKERAILNNAANVVSCLDRQLRFLAIGEAAERMWGYSPDDLLGRSLLTILSCDTADGAHTDFEAIAREGNDTEITTVIKCKDGTLKDSLWTINWSGAAQEFVCVVHDVTELKKIEKLKQAFFSMVSHDLRTPLASMNVNIANMTSGVCGEIPEKGQRLLENSASAMSRLTALVNDLLELDKLDSGKLTLDPECISLRDVCKSSMVALESMADSAGIKLSGPAGDAAVMADERRLVQAITNLLSNAIKFSPRGSKVIVQIRRRDDNVEIAITDQGPGIPADQQSVLFDKYKQGPAVTNVALKGTGLGLAIVNAIVKAHDGEVGVDSEPGKGSTFWIRLKEFTD